MKILIAEDNEDSRNLLVKQLRAYGHEVMAVTNGAEALEQALAEPPDIIVSDILMPKMDGFRLGQECKQNEQLKNIPLVFYSATYLKDEDKKFALSIGAETFIPKPSTPDVIVQKLCEAYEKAKSGALTAAKVTPLEASVFTTEYTKRVAAKLEEKVAQLEMEITERKQAEEALQAEEQNFRNSLDNSPLGIRIVTAEGETIYANRAILDIYGCSSIEEFKSIPAVERHTPKSYAERQERVRKREAGEPVPDYFEQSIIRKDGEVRNLEVFNREVLWGGEKQFQLIYRDITERGQAEEVLRKSEEKYRTLTENVNIGIYRVTPGPKGNFIEVNPALVKILGYKNKKEVLSINVADIYQNPKDRKKFSDKVIRQGFATGEELQIKKKDGTPLIASVSAVIVRAGEKVVGRDDTGNILYFDGIMEDITERRQAEEKIKKTAEEWSTTFDSITDFVSICDKDFRLVRVNKAFADLLKKKPEEFIGKPCYETVHGTSEPVLNCPHKKTIKTKKPAMTEFFEPHLGMHLEVSTSPIFDEKGEVIASVHVIRDISERKKMEEQLIVTDRLASIGELSSGIAHELNNPLTGVIGFSDLLLQKDVSDDVKKDLEVINREAKRTAGVVRNLLTFARKHETKKEPVNINSIIEEVLKLRAYEQKVSNIEVNTQFASDVPEIIADGFRLQQVFINIIINAEHFMTEAHGRGTFTITTERVGDIIRASFADDGLGIAKENLRHLFDPFFTTKEVGKGTGLGLSICHGIITEHGGRIYAESELGKGATFVVELPVRNVDTEGKTNEDS